MEYTTKCTSTNISILVWPGIYNRKSIQLQVVSMRYHSCEGMLDSICMRTTIGSEREGWIWDMGGFALLADNEVVGKEERRD